MYVWSKLSGAKWVDAWEERFQGNANLVVEYLKGGKSIRLKLFCASIKEAEAVQEQWGGSVRKMSGEWKKPAALPPPIKIRDCFLLTQESKAVALKKLIKQHPQRNIISIPPEMAFGTGDHATTSTCLRLLVDIARERKDTTWSMADLGCGTGVLAVAAHKLGAKDLFACDFDPFAVKVTETNTQRNDTPGIRVKEQDVLKWKPRKSGYDVVAANIFSTVLIQAWPVIAKALKPGGDLIVSGILASQAWDCFTAAAEHGLGFSKVMRKGKWVSARGGHMADLA
ncbi:MAG: 50S ribosomal protein L11 methyltransferase [Akkermansiaceae bacterium]|nr:50S ribosomal protein L11 methyltransferase [Akkermansiaceae bacterium]